MKKLLLSTALFMSAVLASSGSHAGCSEWGTVNYVYKSGTGVLAIIGGTACWASITGTTATAAAAVLSTANATGKEGYLTSGGEVAIEYQ
jgi:hypothetical protein